MKIPQYVNGFVRQKGGDLRSFRHTWKVDEGSTWWLVIASTALPPQIQWFTRVRGCFFLVSLLPLSPFLSLPTPPRPSDGGTSMSLRKYMSICGWYINHYLIIRRIWHRYERTRHKVKVVARIKIEAWYECIKMVSLPPTDSRYFSTHKHSHLLNDKLSTHILSCLTFIENSPPMNQNHGNILVNICVSDTSF